jgi:hypothetical protein
VPNEPRDILQELRDVMDAVSEPVLQMSDEDLLAEAIESGENPEQAASNLRALLRTSVKDYKQRHLRAAKAEYEREAYASNQCQTRLPTSAEERRALLNLVCKQNPEIGAALTLRHRNFEVLTDADVTTSLEELQELGALDQLRKDKDSDR